MNGQKERAIEKGSRQRVHLSGQPMSVIDRGTMAEGGMNKERDGRGGVIDLKGQER